MRSTGLRRSAGTLPELLDRQAECHADRLLYRYLDGSARPAFEQTAGTLAVAAARAARVLEELGAKGERVLILSEPGPEYLEWFFGSMLAGALPVPAVTPANQHQARRLAAVAADCTARFAVTSPRRPAALADALRGTQLIGDRCHASAEPVGGHASCDAADVAFLQYTSGSTSMPRGVVITHANLLANLGQIVSAFGLTCESAAVTWLPPYHDMGLIGGLLTPLYALFATDVLAPRVFARAPLAWLQALSASGAQVSGGPTFAYDLCAQELASTQEGLDFDLSRWTTAFVGAEPVRPDALAEFVRQAAPFGFTPDALHPCYGLAEATLIVTCTDRGRIRNVAAGRGATTTAVCCGRPVPDVSVAITDTRTGQPCAPGEIGEVLVTGPAVASGYWHGNRSAGLEFDARVPGDSRSFLRTGDLGLLTEQGELVPVGRIKELMIIRGRNVYPHDLEDAVRRALSPHPCRAMAAFAVGEQVVVLVECAAPVDGLTGLLDRARAVATAETEVTIAAVAAVRTGCIPRTSSGKIQRGLAADLYRTRSLELRAISQAAVDERLWLARASAVRRELAGLGPGQQVARILRHLRERAAAAAPAVTPADDMSLTELGLDSAALVSIGHELTVLSGCQPAMAELLDAPLAQLAAAARPGTGDAAASERSPRAIPARCALIRPHEDAWLAAPPWPSAAWFVDSLCPGAGNVFFAAEVTAASWDLRDLRSAAVMLVRRHEALRIHYRFDGSQVEWRLAGRADGQGIETADVGSGSVERLAEEAHRPFDLAAGPLLRIVYGQRPDGRRIVLVAAPHVAVDFAAMVTLSTELFILLADLAADLEAAPLYSDCLEAAATSLDSDFEAEALAHFRGLLEGVPRRLQLPARPPGAATPGPASERTIRLAPATRAALERLARAERTTLFTVLLAVFHAALHDVCGAEASVVGIPASIRADARSAGTVGLCANQVPTVSHVPPAATLRSLIRELRSQLAASYEYASYPTLWLASRLGPAGKPQAGSLIEASFVLHRGRAESAGADAFGIAEGVTTANAAGVWRSLHLPRKLTTLPISLLAARDGEALAMSLWYLTEIVDARTADCLAEALTLRASLAEGGEDDLLTAGTELGTAPLVPALSPRARQDTSGQRAGCRRATRQVADVFKEILDRPEVAADDDFFTLEGQSLQAIQIAARLTTASGRHITPKSIFDGLTVAELGELTGEWSESVTGTNPSPTGRGDAEMPVTSGQYRLWIRNQLMGDADSMAMPAIVELSGAASISTVTKAFDLLVERHDALRTIFGSRDGRPFQMLGPTPELSIINWEGQPESALEQAQAQLAGLMSRPWDLARGPLLRAEAIVADGSHIYLVLVVHHIVCDGWSARILLEDFAAIHRAIADGGCAALPPGPSDRAGAALVFESKAKFAARAQADVSYFTDRLRGAPELMLPVNSAGPGQVVASKSAADVGALLHRIAVAHRRTVSVIAAAALLTTLRRFSGSADIVVGLDVAGRDDPRLDRLVGYFGNQIAVRCDLSEAASFPEVVGAVSAEIYEALAHAAVPYEDVVTGMRARYGGDVPAELFGVKIVHQSRPEAGQETSAGTMLSFLETGWASAADPLALWIWDTGRAARLEIHHRTSSCPVELADLILHDLIAVLRAADPVGPDPTDGLNHERRVVMTRQGLPDLSDIQLVAIDQTAEPAVGVDDSSGTPVLVVEAAGGADAVGWLTRNETAWRAGLDVNAAMLMRGFGISTAQALLDVSRVLFREPYDTAEHPRNVVSGRVVTPVAYPADQALLWHNEDSFNARWPTLLAFACATPPGTGGQTTVADGARTWGRLDPRLRARFVDAGVCYVRRFIPGLGLPWSTVFRTSDRDEIERICRRMGIRAEWEGDVLTTYAVRPAVLAGKDQPTVWFAQILHWHPYCLPAETQAELRTSLRGVLPRECTFGDGGVIPDAFVAELIAVSRDIEYVNQWQRGDLMVVNNRRAAHGRNPYRGPRDILVSFGDPSGFTT
jgi:acyl-CoA synthetase (AMP-forming)/AMP-acid ligase II